jgi:hypothetical protein
VALALVVLLHILHNPLSSPEFVIGTVVVSLASIFFVLPNVLVRPDADLTREQLLKARNDVRTAGIQIVGGAALLVGLLFTSRSLGLNQQGQINDRFTKATEQLGSDRLATRLGGISALERITRDSRPDQGPAMKALTDFVQEHAPTPRPGAVTRTTVSMDVQAILTVVGRREASSDPAG